MKKKLLVLGANGMLGGSLLRYFSTCADYEVVGTVRSQSAQFQVEKVGFTNVISDIDVLIPNSLDDVLEKVRPDIVFNCIGLIKQLSESKQPIPAIEINSLLPHRLAELCTKNNSKLIHFSTDCVFSGIKGNYTEEEIPDATDIYGRSKLLGEVSYDGHLTLRTSIIGHELASGVSLIDWFLNQEDDVKGYSKAVFSGLPTCCVAEFIENYIFQNPNISGIYHLSVDPIDKYQLLSLVKNIYDVDIRIEDNCDFVIDRSLNSDALRLAVGFKPLPWPELVMKMHNEYKEYFK